MLLLFKISNYKSYVNEAVFTMVPAPKQKGLSYSVLNTKVNKKMYKSLSSAVFYGPNASGKTNIISALETLKTIIQHGNIADSKEFQSFNVAAYYLGLIPNSYMSDRKNVKFYIKYIYQKIVFEYELEIDLGVFLISTDNREVVRESLICNDEVMFVRNKLDFSFPKYQSNDKFIQNKELYESIIKQGLKSDELLLTNGYKNVIDSEIAIKAVDWFDSHLEIVYRCDLLKNRKKLPDNVKIEFDYEINELSSLFGSDNKIAYSNNDKSSEAVLESALKVNDRDLFLPIELHESFGTIRLLRVFPLIKKTLLCGGTLFVDELDASLHPMALMSIINIFHNDEINLKGAQLIFNTHNPIFLNNNIFRRDEINFVEKSNNIEGSKLYRLSDFRTYGDSGARKNDNYMKNYFVNQYGAIKNIDFTPLFKKMIINDNMSFDSDFKNDKRE